MVLLNVANKIIDGNMQEQSYSDTYHVNAMQICQHCNLVSCKFLIRNRFHVKLRILSPENCKQSLRVRS